MQNEMFRSGKGSQVLYSIYSGTMTVCIIYLYMNDKVDMVCTMRSRLQNMLTVVADEDMVGGGKYICSWKLIRSFLIIVICRRMIRKICELFIGNFRDGVEDREETAQEETRSELIIIQMLLLVLLGIVAIKKCGRTEETKEV